VPDSEFVRRDATHIVPPYCRRVRYAGLLGQSKRKDLLPRCRELLVDRVRPVFTASSSDSGGCTDVFAETDEDKPKPPRACYRCRGTEFVLIESYSPDIDYSYLLEPCVSASGVDHETNAVELTSIPP